MQYTVAIKNFLGFWKKYEVTNHSFDGRFFELHLLGGDILMLPYKGRPFKLLNLQRQLPAAQHNQQSQIQQEAARISQELAAERQKTEQLRQQLAAKPSAEDTRQAKIEDSARERVNAMLGREPDAEIGSGRILQGGVRTHHDVGFN